MRRVGSTSATVASRAPGRAGFAYRGLIIALGLLLTVAAIAWAAFPSLIGSSQDDDGPQPYVVTRGDFIHDATERGNVESASNVEIVSKVESVGGSGGGGGSSGGGGTAILYIVDEGYVITEEDIEFNEEGEAVGKILVELDSASLNNQLLQQKIVVENSRATMIQAEAAVETAEIDYKEYLQGIYKQLVKTIDIQIQEAEEELSRLKDYLVYSERLNAKGYVSDLELEGDRSAVTKAENKLELARLDLKTLEDFTKEKTTKQLQAAIDTAGAKLAAAKSSHQLDVERHDRILQQIKNCTICATETGQIVYANRQGYRGNGEVVIEEGTMIRERQVIFRLPDPSKMQVKANINEGKISMVDVGMEATIRLDAFPDVELAGVVTEVSEYPASSGWMGPAVKEYETLIKITSPPPDLRPGYTAEVRIRIEQLEDVLQVPVQSVLEHGNTFYVVFYENGTFRAHEVKIGSTNDKTVVIVGGLEEGDRIVLDATSHRDKFDLPELAPNEGARPNRRAAPGGADGRPQTPKSGGPQEGASAAKRPPDPGQMFGRLDKNSDGKLDQSEQAAVPAGMRAGLTAADTNKDGAIDRGELSAAMAKLRAGGSSPGGKAPGGGAAGGRPGGRP
ncbi:MAG: HlyD family efflux transporter periplasmic adaptor subunit [Thermoguttaceae bacterium]